MNVHSNSTTICTVDMATYLLVVLETVVREPAGSELVGLGWLVGGAGV